MEILGSLPGITGDCFDLVYDPEKRWLWFTTRTHQNRWHLARVSLNESAPDSASDYKSFSSLVSASDNCLICWKNRTLFNSPSGLLQLGDAEANFQPLQIEALPQLQQSEISAMAVDSLHQLWIAFRGGVLYRIDPEGKADIPCALSPREDFIRIVSVPNSESVYLISYDKNAIQVPIQRPSFYPSLRPTIANLLPHSGLTIDEKSRKYQVKSWPIEFQFAAQGSFIHPSQKYQYRLIGLEDQWSPWTSQSKQTFHALPSGKYEFQVRTQSKLFELGPHRSISFVIPPAWYETALARTVFGCMILLAGVGIASWRSNQLRERSNQLERVVHLRTAELADAKKDLEERVRQRTIDLEESNQQLQRRLSIDVRLSPSCWKASFVIERSSKLNRS